MNVAETILSRGRDSAIAVQHCGAVLTYGELRAVVVQYAGGLLARGYRRGDRVGIFSENNLFFVKAYLGIIRAGLVAVPLPTDLTAEAFSKTIPDAGIKAMFVSDHLLNRARSWTSEFGLTLLPENQETNFSGSFFLRRRQSMTDANSPR